MMLEEEDRDRNDDDGNDGDDWYEKHADKKFKCKSAGHPLSLYRNGFKKRVNDKGEVV